jgi:hypothetical protein
VADDSPSTGSTRNDPVSHNGASHHEPRRPDPHEGAVPPGYDWPTHGGYLGCLLSVIASCLIGGFLGSTFFSALSHLKVLPVWAAAMLTVAIFVGCVVGLGRLGWVLGRRFYREYPQPYTPVWGEDDEPEGTPEDPAPEQPAPGETRWLMP